MASHPGVITLPPITMVCSTVMETHSGILYGEHPLRSNYLLVFLQISTVLIIARGLQVILKPLKQPRVVSDILAGLIIGPSLLGRFKGFELFPSRGKLVVQTLSEMAVMLFLFINGVQIDAASIWKAGKKTHFIASYSVFLPAALLLVIGRFSLSKELMERGFIEKDSSAGSYPMLDALAGSLSITSAHVVYPILKELELLNSDVGRLALSVTLISDVMGWTVFILLGIFEQPALYQRLLYVGSLLGILVVIFGILRSAAIWVNQRTAVGHHVDQVYVIGFVTAALFLGFATDVIGATVAQGPLFLGLAIPPGPPLGATLVDRTETIVTNIFMPLFFATVGLNCDVFTLKDDWLLVITLMFFILAGYCGKFICTLLPSIYNGMSFRDSVNLGLMNSLRAQTEMMVFLHWKHLKLIKVPAFTVMILCTTMVTAVSTPLIEMIYIPTRSYKTNKRRTIMHSTGPNTTFNIVACVHEPETVPALIDVLKISNPTMESPISVHVLHLVELVGRLAPIFMSHGENPKHFSGTIWKALKIYKKSIGDYVTLCLFTAVAPYKTMHHEICKLALEKKASLVILPTHRTYSKDLSPSSSSIPWTTTKGSTDNAEYIVSVLAHAPCSVRILIERDPYRRLSIARKSSYHVILLFLGGADAREALAYADKMANEGNNVSLTVVRFLLVGNDVVCINELEKAADDDLFLWFLENHSSNNMVEYRDYEVQNGVETVCAIQELNNDRVYDLWMVGREKGVNRALIAGLSEWGSSSQLGPIGEFISSPDFEGTASVLVIQQQRLVNENYKGDNPYDNI